MMKEPVLGQRKVILYIALSIDGYIAAPGDDLDFLSVVQREGEDYGYSELLAATDTLITGRKTYEWVVKEVGTYPNQDRKVYVIGSSSPTIVGNIEWYQGDVAELIHRLKQVNSDKHIFCEGGAQLASSLLRAGLIDEMILSVIPVIIGDGIRLFERSIGKTALRLVKSRQFDSGLVQLHYEKA